MTNASTDLLKSRVSCAKIILPIERCCGPCIGLDWIGLDVGVEDGLRVENRCCVIFIIPSTWEDVVRDGMVFGNGGM